MNWLDAGDRTGYNEDTRSSGVLFPFRQSFSLLTFDMKCIIIAIDANGCSMFGAKHRE